ncbi:MAG: hypothetical protein ACO1RA_11575 [Planctomycetaceae bacterium]
MENWEAELKAFAAARSKLLDKVEHTLEGKHQRETVARKESQDATAKMSAAERQHYLLALKTIQQMFSQGNETAREVCKHIEEQPEPVWDGQNNLPYAARFPSARTLIVMEPHTSKRLVGMASESKDSKFQFLIGALLKELDGFEIAKLRLDLELKSLASNKNLTDSHKTEAFANLKAIRVLFDDRDTSEFKRVDR